MQLSNPKTTPLSVVKPFVFPKKGFILKRIRKRLPLVKVKGAKRERERSWKYYFKNIFDTTLEFISGCQYKGKNSFTKQKINPNLTDYPK